MKLAKEAKQEYWEENGSRQLWKANIVLQGVKNFQKGKTIQNQVTI